MVEIEKIRKDFPIFSKGLVYFDNAATTQRPMQVIKAMSDFYCQCNGSVAKGLYSESVAASEIYRCAKQRVANFIGGNECEIIFCANATDGLNLFSSSLEIKTISNEDELVVSVFEHHSNYTPWQMFAKKNNMKMRLMNCDSTGEIRDEELSVINRKTRIVAVAYESNVIGKPINIKKICEIAHKNGAIVVVDAAQAVLHMPINVKDDNVDVLVFSGHKMLGPFGVGVLFIDQKIHDLIKPSRSGGGMVRNVSELYSDFKEMPFCLEGGTSNIAAIVGLDQAIRYINSIGYDAICSLEQKLMQYLFNRLKKNKKIEIIGSDRPEDHRGVVSMTIDKWHPHDFAGILAERNIAVRAGVHCAQPIHNYLKVKSTLRISTAFYNTMKEVMYLMDVMDDVLDMKI